ncbi:MAG: UDP-glucose 4-epimerase GalE [Hyphomicrobium sp.]|nr:MAG: UDP-glucose 4-epimerase GalE [Hyphomicrobium sp.]
MSKPVVLVVGGAGYIGAHTCKALSHAGYVPIVLDNLSTGHKSFVKWGPLIHADIRDAASCAAAIKEHAVSAVLHFAGSAYVGESVSDPAKYYDNNVLGSLSLLRAMREADCSRICFSSTCAVYGEPDSMPIREDTPQLPVNPYGASKLMVERILMDFAKAYDLKAIALRYFNAAGADPDLELGELRDPETHIIPRAMMALQGHLDDFSVFGEDFPTPDGTAIRDYIHVSDLAAAHVTAIGRLLGGGQGGVFNLGTGRGYSVKEVLDTIERATRQKLPKVDGRRRPGDPAALFSDPTLARQELGFAPKYSDLSFIIETAWAWHQRAHPKKNSTIDRNEMLLAG